MSDWRERPELSEIPDDLLHDHNKTMLDSREQSKVPDGLLHDHTMSVSIGRE